MALALPPGIPPLVIPKTRTTVLAGERLGRQSLTFEIQAQSRADINWALRFIATRDTAEQIKLGNPPSVVIVDNSKAAAQDFAAVKRRVDILYGTVLASAAMRIVEQTLKQNIERTTRAITGRLRNVSGMWRWKLVDPDGTRIVTAATELPAFTRTSMLILEPYSVPHATRANKLIVSSGGLKTRRANRMSKGEMGPPKPKAPVGFLRATVEALRHNSAFKDFAVKVVFSQAFKVPGELSQKQGTGSIVIKLKRAVIRF